MFRSTTHWCVLYFFFLVLRRPPSFTLFPYTTLFRSRRRRRTRRGQRHRAVHGDRRAGQDRRRQLDRKSTRLNSSHVSTSYAVFCLKNKNVDGCIGVPPDRRLPPGEPDSLPLGGDEIR